MTSPGVMNQQLAGCLQPSDKFDLVHTVLRILEVVVSFRQLGNDI